jgi:cell division protein FtsZ
MFSGIVMEVPSPQGARIKVIGVGGGGGNAINNMISEGLSGVDYIAANTDAQALASNRADDHVQLGRETTRGLGAGGNPEVGYRSAEEDADALRASLEGADMVFLTTGLGGGTGTGAAPVIARVARELGILTVAVVTRPFTFEGKHRARLAEEGLHALAEHVDTLIVIPNDRILQIVDRRMPLKNAFRVVDSVVVEAVRGISDMINAPGYINVDFADVQAVMRGKGMALMGTGRASGDDRAQLAAQAAISSPLLEDARIEGATTLLVTITGSSDMSIADIEAAMSLIQQSAAADTYTKMGAVIDESMGDDIKVTVIATGYDRTRLARAADQTQLGRLQTGSTSSRPLAHNAPTQPNLRAVSQEVPVYAQAGLSAHERAVAQAMPMHASPAHQSGHYAAQRMATPSRAVPPPQYESELDVPTFQRKQTGQFPANTPVASHDRRDLLTSGPYGGPNAELDLPTFRRK